MFSSDLQILCLGSVESVLLVQRISFLMFVMYKFRLVFFMGFKVFFCGLGEQVLGFDFLILGDDSICSLDFVFELSLDFFDYGFGGLYVVYLLFFLFSVFDVFLGVLCFLSFKVLSWWGGDYVVLQFFCFEGGFFMFYCSIFVFYVLFNCNGSLFYDSLFNFGLFGGYVCFVYLVVGVVGYYLFYLYFGVMGDLLWFLFCSFSFVLGFRFWEFLFVCYDNLFRIIMVFIQECKDREECECLLCFQVDFFFGDLGVYDVFSFYSLQQVSVLFEGF